ncbi:ABC transporter permease [Periweissella cryptocerci]|uniref:ABC transporter permease n=1 Tax=Periweissella cryptocerci TaxID=2506420 RepID=A0A4P6YRK7_9LACO|nr:ABC transporter permease [Periweissella cryptocerci]QBO35260.1 ABC transporter permease [Periweissella cryptocerci]
MVKRFGNKMVSLLFATIVLVVLWTVAAQIFNKVMLPTPLAVVQAFPTLFGEDQVLKHVGVSLLRVISGLVISLILGFGLGVWMGRNKWANRLFDPIIYLTYPIPKLALLPILMVLFGLGESSKILLIILIIFPQVVLAVRDAVKNIPDNLYNIYGVLRANQWQQFKHITLPASAYALLSASRVSLGIAISVLFFAETYGTQWGMGYFIMDAWQRMDYPTMYGAVVVLSLLGLTLFLLIDAVGYLALKWERK